MFVMWVSRSFVTFGEPPLFDQLLQAFKKAYFGS